MAINPNIGFAGATTPPSAQNILSAVESIQTSRAQNALAQFNLAAAPGVLQRQEAQEQRAVAKEGRDASTFQTEENFRAAATLKPFLDNNDIEGAIRFIASDGVEEDEQQLISLLQSGDEGAIAAIKTDNDAFIDAGNRLGVFKGQGAAQETFRAATPDELQQLGPNVVGAQISDVSGKATNIQTAQAGGSGVREQKITDLMAQGFDREKASKITDGIIKVEINDKTGKVLMFDTSTGNVEELQISNQQTQTPVPQTGETLFELIDVASGPVATATEKVEQASSFLGGKAGPVSEARQRFKTETQQMVRALSINPRFPVAEQKRILEEINIQPSFGQGADLLRAKVRSVDASLRVRLAQAENDAADPNLDTETRQSQGSNASSIRNFLSVLGVPQDEGATQETELEAIDRELAELREQL